MFEITYSDKETFEAYQNAGKAHKGGTYDFSGTTMASINLKPVPTGRNNG